MPTPEFLEPPSDHQMAARIAKLQHGQRLTVDAPDGGPDNDPAVELVFDGADYVLPGMGRLGSGEAPASIVGAILDRVASETAKSAERSPAKEGG